MGISIMLISIFSACKREEFSTDPSFQLSFSKDTLGFDTVLGTVGSSTRFFKVFNQNDEPLNISSVELAAGAASPYRMNFNGKSGVAFKDVRIEAKDSIWVFVEVTTEATTAQQPFIVEDFVNFVTNGNQQSVVLHAYSQNAIFHFPSANGELSLVSDVLWTDSLPHVVYGKVLVESGATLTISKGSQLYFHSGASIWVKEGASLKVQGTTSEMVVMQGDRLESWYKETPGQWRGLVLDENARDISLVGLSICNATVGIYSQAINVAETYPLVLGNTVIKNCSQQGLWLRNTGGLFYNLEVVNCGAEALLLEGGKDLSFMHCNFSNYGMAPSSDLSLSVRLKDYYTKDLQNFDVGIANCSFHNSIVAGALTSNLIVQKNSDQFDVSFHHSILNASTSQLIDIAQNNVQLNVSPEFNSITNNDFSIAHGSPAQDNGDLMLVNDNASILTTDLMGESRVVDGKPDVGPREFKPEE